MTGLNKIYFLGIGGIGMSALARYYNNRKVEIFGYDKTKSILTVALEAEGMQIHYEDSPEQIPMQLDLVIMTPAIPKTLQEYQELIHRQIPIKKRSEVLGMISAQHKNIAVAGTHGKTTTSILLAHILHYAGKKITAFLGGISVNTNSNFIDEGDDWMILEADEYDKSFLHLRPDIAVIGSLDADHLDIYGTRDVMVQNYLEFAGCIKKGGHLLLSDVISKADQQLFYSKFENELTILNFGLQRNSDVSSQIKNTSGVWILFDYLEHGKILIEDLKMRLPGKHNIQNVTAAIKIARMLDVRGQHIMEALDNFQGIQRRFEWKYEGNGKILIDDYAHHPEELRAAIMACRDCYPEKHVTGIFQPHLYSRTRDFLKEFAEVLSGLDRIILVELYPARELPIEGISSASIFERITLTEKFLCEKSKLIPLLESLDLEVLITLGAGDLDVMLDQIKEVLDQKI
ncbi:MAG: UDP-N-acetylmuramate--L-alanine ligase [Bacteroidota bacterium]|nr:UDP-N-acetylmuramate--L-alanine ligase [Bacteroidota bacterium]